MIAALDLYSHILAAGSYADRFTDSLFKQPYKHTDTVMAVEYYKDGLYQYATYPGGTPLDRVVTDVNYPNRILFKSFNDWVLVEDVYKADLTDYVNLLPAPRV